MFETVEQVGIGHPDKVADRISDAILDELLKQDANSRVAVETLIKDEKVVVAGEITSTATIDICKIVESVFIEAGYEMKPKVEINISKQSPDIACGVDTGGAGDQGIMVGYAINETDHYMPLAHEIATKILIRANMLRMTGAFPYAKSDMKSQVTIDYENLRIDTIVVSIQHEAEYNEKEFKEFIIKYIIDPIIADYKLNKDYRCLINPTGAFVIGGSVGDTGLTGRKIIADSYGTVCSHGGGAYSGKDPTKVDRSGAYIARKIAKHIVASGMAEMAEVKLAFAIGVVKPVSIDIECYDTENIDIEIIKSVVRNEFDLTPAGIIKELELKKPIYRRLSSYGHFGVNAVDMPWEKLDKLGIFKQVLEFHNKQEQIVEKCIRKYLGGI